MFHAFVANIIFLIVGIASNFLLPKYLPVADFAMLKTYSLYIGYAGLFTFGFNDGTYIKYGGALLDKIDKKEFADDFKSFYVLQFIVGVLLVIGGLISGKYIVVAFGVGLFATNIGMFARSLFQAMGEFMLYGVALNFQKILLFTAELMLLFALSVTDYKWYINAQIIVVLISALLLTTIFERKLRFLGMGRPNMDSVKKNIKVGFAFLTGNTISAVFTGIDRWFVKILMVTNNFAVYAFAVSMENMMNVFITPISISMYSSICNDHANERLRSLKEKVTIWGFLMIAAAFPLRVILELFLTKYIASINLIFILFGANAFYAIIKSIYINLYKAREEQSKYMKQMIAVLGVAVLLNAVLYTVFGTMESIAVGTLSTSIIWLIICEVSDRAIGFGLRGGTAVVLMLTSFLATGFMENPYIGLALYIGIWLTVSMVFLNVAFFGLCHDVYDGVKSKISAALSKNDQV